MIFDFFFHNFSRRNFKNLVTAANGWMKWATHIHTHSICVCTGLIFEKRREKCQQKSNANKIKKHDTFEQEKISIKCLKTYANEETQLKQWRITTFDIINALHTWINSHTRSTTKKKHTFLKWTKRQQKKKKIELVSQFMGGIKKFN